MSTAFSSYALITTLTILLVIIVVGVDRARKLTNLIGWYLLVFFLTYIVHPAAAEWTQDFRLYDLLNIQPLEQQWGKMVFAVTLSLGCLAIGYRMASGGRSVAPRSYVPNLEQNKTAFAVALGLCIWGYVSILISGGSANADLQTNDAMTGYGVANGSTFWLIGSDVFVSTGATLFYILNRKLLVSLAVALPWLLYRLSFGYGRIQIIGHTMALLAVWGMASPNLVGRKSEVSRIRQGFQLAALFAGLAFIVIVIFPALSRSRTFFSEGVNSETVGNALSVNQTAEDVSYSTGDLAGFESTLYFLQMDQPVWGTYYIYFYFLKPIPRVIFPSKGFPDTLAAEWFGVERDLNYNGQDAGCIGWAFQQWGWGGIVLEFLFTGWILRKLEGMRDNYPYKHYLMLAYAGFFSMLPQLGRDSVIVMIEERWLFGYGIPCAILWWLTRSRSGAPIQVSSGGFNLESRTFLPSVFLAQPGDAESSRRTSP